MPSPNPYPPRSRIECVGPGCHAITSCVSAVKERWQSMTKRQYPKLNQPEYLGWCRHCAEKYGVEEPRR